MCKCKIGWIKDNIDIPTYDHNDAIALAVCYDPRSFGEKGSEAFPICEEHAKVKEKFWKLLPLEGQDIKEAHQLVKEDHRYFRVIPDLVSESIKRSFSNQADEILNQLRWSGDHWSFTRWGIYVGVEESDGYIHT